VNVFQVRRSKFSFFSDDESLLCFILRLVLAQTRHRKWRGKKWQNKCEMSFQVPCCWDEDEQSKKGWMMIVCVCVCEKNKFNKREKFVLNGLVSFGVAFFVFTARFLINHLHPLMPPFMLWLLLLPFLRKSILCSLPFFRDLKKP
jgi:hypothetical protein